MEPYRDSLEHLFDELHRLDLLLNLRVAEARRDPARGRFDQFRGLFVSEEEIDAALSARPAPAAADHGVQALAGCIREIGERIARRTAASAEAGVQLPLLRLGRLFSLTPFDVDALLIALAPDLDLKYGKLYAYLQDDATRRQASVDLILHLLCNSIDSRIEGRRRLAPGAPLLRHGLLAETGHGERTGFLSRLLAVDAGLLGYLLETNEPDEVLRPFTRLVVPRVKLDEALLPPAIKERFAPHFLSRARSGPGALAAVLHGRPGSGRKYLAEALCGRLGIALLVADARLMPQQGVPQTVLVRRLLREGCLRRCAVYFDHADAMAPAERAAIERLLEEYRGVVFFGAENPWDAGSGLMQLEVPLPDCGLRAELWRHFLTQGGHPAPSAADLTALADKFALHPGAIRAAVERAARAAPVSLPELYAACRAQSGAGLAALARKIAPVYGWNDIVLPADQVAQLREICAHVEHRHQVFGNWGFDGKFSLGKGLNILFAGPSGTGKTMAAEIMARELGLDLYKIDLSSVVSKYIGETEKNLKAVFQEAEQSNAILFFDEADAIFGKRSEVKDSHDRYANIEINYLLQKMEEYSGTVILASNLRKNIDDAFLRRLRFVVEFPFPEEEYRLRIWRGVFPKSTPLADDVDFRFLAGRLKVPGGAIRNIALQAAFLAACDGGVVRMEQIMRSARREFQKMGRVCVKADFGPYLDLLQEVS